MLDALPLFTRLADARRVLLAGAGGGFDVMSALPLAFALQRMGKDVHLANLTFSYLGASDAPMVAPGVYAVSAETVSDERYFPERHLAVWLRSKGCGDTIFTIEKTGVLGMSAAYRALHERLGFDALVLVDGGTDILMSGDEAGLGTPAEDITSLLGAHALDEVSTKLVVAIGFGVDAYHGVAHVDFLENVAALARDGGYLGAFSLLPSMPEVRDWLDAVRYVQTWTPGRESIVCASVADAVQGRFGDHRSVARLRASDTELFINPLMSLVWTFDLDAVAKRCRYGAAIRETRGIFEVNAIIEAFRASTMARPRRSLPM